MGIDGTQDKTVRFDKHQWLLGIIARTHQTKPQSFNIGALWVSIVRVNPQNLCIRLCILEEAKRQYEPLLYPCFAGAPHDVPHRAL